MRHLQLLKERVYLKDVQIHGGEIGSHPYMSGLITKKKGLDSCFNSG